MKHNRLYLTIALWGTVLTACQTIENTLPDEREEKPVEGVWTLRIQAAKTTATKALDLINSGGTLNAYWTSADIVHVYKAGNLIGTLDVIPDEGDKPLTATLSGTITSGGPAVDDELTLLIPRTEWDYTGQEGMAPSADGPLASLYDYAMAQVEIASISNGAITTKTPASFENQQSIYRFGFKAGSGGNPMLIKEFTMTSTQEKLVRGRSLSDGIWTSAYGSLKLSPYNAATNTLYTPSDKFYYMALRNENDSEDDTYSFTVVGSDDALYLGVKDIGAEHLGDGKFISAKNIQVTKTSFAPSTGTISTVNDVL